MSEGGFVYGSRFIADFSEELHRKIEAKEGGFGNDCMEALKIAHKIISQTAKIARHIDRLYSGDHGEESFMRAVMEEL